MVDRHAPVGRLKIFIGHPLDVGGRHRLVFLRTLVDLLPVEERLEKGQLDQERHVVFKPAVVARRHPVFHLSQFYLHLRNLICNQ